ncbi:MULTISPECIES: PspC domain-containing protein [Enterococcus]|uniref:Phage shock protein PspC N-terminal domain-containing protein n=1 Tax=Enterococcus diestrammenae TaxID=1155073 RepID=A0ABV0F2Y7_9ENTE|nr:PspC domain-containing protein [Enterococcus diestrammenae]KAF1300277.1 PspC family transcriptional regulator [Enterococcus diestrammenae]HIX70546.1 PspC domain-containing protein [Candidatus Enterococcus stercoravium]
MRKKLTKSTNNVVITGTLGGIADFLGIDATIIRVIYVFLSLVTVAFPGITLYIIMALIIPSGRSSQNGGYGRNPYYQNQNSRTNRDYKQFSQKPKQPKQAEKIDDDDWSDF